MLGKWQKQGKLRQREYKFLKRYVSNCYLYLFCYDECRGMVTGVLPLTLCLDPDRHVHLALIWPVWCQWVQLLDCCGPSAVQRSKADMGGSLEDVKK